MKKLTFNTFLAVLLSAGLLACSHKEQKPVLEGSLEVSEPTEITLVYDHDGDIVTADLATDSVGGFVFDGPIQGGASDVILYIGHEIYGAYLENGKNVVMDIAGDDVKFLGDNLELNEFANAYQRAFSVWKFKPTPDHPFDYEEYKGRLDKSTLDARQYLAAITDNGLRDRYGKYIDSYHRYYTLQFMDMDKKRSEESLEASQEKMMQLIDSIDPNADVSRLTGTLMYWYNYSPIRQSEANDIIDYTIEQFSRIDSALTNEANKKSLYRMAGSFVFMFDTDDASVARFMDGVKQQLNAAPGVRAEFEGYIAQRAKVLKDGSPLPDVDPVLIAPDGSKTTLQAAIGGKVTYIDIWATWCAPCCREIPYMEKLVERFKGNDKINFISISEDEDRDAWLKKINKDNPQWPNYIFDSKSGGEFLDAIQCSAIPRFLLIGADGRFVQVDAVRPSSDEIDSILKAAISE